jgi:alpha-tubulin suppressor-like RCC1 family protein
LIETTEIGKIEPPDSTRVVAISAGGEHSLILNSEGRVYSFGCHLSGQLGLGYVNNKSTPTLIEYLVAGDSLLSATNMIAISAGGDSSFMLNSEGQVFSFGYNDDGQLGLGHRGGRNIPTLIEYQVIGNVLLPTTKVIAISTGGRHSLILNSKRRIFSFGYNDDGQLGLGDETNTYSPNLISGLAI